MLIETLSVFPGMFGPYLATSIMGRAQAHGIYEFCAHDLRDWTHDRHRSTDDEPYGGGQGMVMQAQPIYDAYQAVCEKAGHKVHCIYLTPQGQLFKQDAAKSLAKYEDICLLCGHYEGVDERVLEEIVDEYYSIGDYVLTGGELPSLVMIDAISRMVPGVLTNHESGEDESLENDLLEYPQYSRPETWKDRTVPGILLSGDHAKVDAWRLEQSILRTKERRPDLYEKYIKSHG